MELIYSQTRDAAGSGWETATASGARKEHQSDSRPGGEHTKRGAGGLGEDCGPTHNQEA